MRTLEITTKIGCSNNCLCCPQDVLSKAYAQSKAEMTFENFSLILANTPIDVRIDFSGFCEPFLNKEAAKTITHAAMLGYDVALYTTLVGITKNSYELLFDIGLGLMVVVHLPDSKVFTYDSKKYLEYLMVWKDLEIPCEYMSLGEVDKSLTSALDNVPITKSSILSRAGNVNGEKVAAKGKVESCAICGDEYSHNVVLPNGDVFLCCMDYGLEHKIGNLYTDNYDKLSRSCEYSLCKKCEWAIL